MGWADEVQVAATDTGWDWRDVVDELERDGLGVDQSQVRHESRVALLCAIVRNFVASSVADAVSLIRTSSQKKCCAAVYQKLVLDYLPRHAPAFPYSLAQDPRKPGEDRALSRRTWGCLASDYVLCVLTQLGAQEL